MPAGAGQMPAGAGQMPPSAGETELKPEGTTKMKLRSTRGDPSTQYGSDRRCSSRWQGAGKMPAGAGQMPGRCHQALGKRN